VVLPTGEIEVLATNLMDKQAITVADLADLYRQRWGIETIIDSLKNQLGLMIFSGLKPAAILQDIYATMFVYNLRQLLINEVQLIVNEQVKESIRAKYKQKTNKNVASGLLKPKIISIFLAKEPKEIIDELIAYFVKNKLPVYPNKEPLKREKSLARIGVPNQ
jgi:Transposase DDE domain